jgi:hypothetical protein
LGKGGKAGDRVLLSVQDPSGFNNANFASPPEYVYSRVLFPQGFLMGMFAVGRTGCAGCSSGRQRTLVLSVFLKKSFNNFHPVAKT